MVQRTTARAALIALLLGVLAAVPTVPSVAADPVRIMLLGDSITAGGAGDWTWRYRLWHHLTDQGVPVDLVGPHRGHEDGREPEYVDLDFDLDHAAVPGMGYATMRPSATELASSYRPDVVVVLLGVNDMIFWGGSPRSVHAGAVELVNDVRAVRPDTAFVFGRLTPFWAADVDATNALLDDLPEQMATPTSPVVIADTDADWDLSANTWDGLHLSATGEVAVAAAFADALADLGIGAAPTRPLPVVPNGPRVAPVLEASAGDGEATLTWRNPPGSDRSYVWTRDVTLGGPWSRQEEASVGDSVVLELVNGHEHDVMLQPVKGTHAAADDVRSNVVRVAPLAPPPSALAGLTVQPGVHGIALSWTAPADGPAPTGYRVRWWPQDSPDEVRSRTVSGTSHWVHGLVAGRTYAVEVAAVNDTTPGPGAGGTALVAGRPPGAPRGLAARVLDDRRLRITWNALAGATHHEVQVRRGDGPWQLVGEPRGHRWTTVPYRRGRTLEVRVRGWDGLLAGAFSRPVGVTVR